MAEHTQLLSTWSQHFEGVFDVNSFYATVEAAVRRRKVPNVEFIRTNMKEGGMFSSSREYLRIKRGDLRFDICGAPFANGFFVSARLFTESRFMDERIGAMSEGGLLSKMAGAATAKIVGADTYYKMDTAQMFLHLAQQGLTEAVDEMRKSANLPPMSDADRKPILQGFFQ